jgi:hypothetical protein
MSDEPPRRPSSLVCRPMSHAFVPLYPRVVFMRKREIYRLRVSQMDSTDTQQTKHKAAQDCARCPAVGFRGAGCLKGPGVTVSVIYTTSKNKNSTTCARLRLLRLRFPHAQKAAQSTIAMTVAASRTMRIPFLTWQRHEPRHEPRLRRATTHVAAEAKTAKNSGRTTAR